MEDYELFRLIQTARYNHGSEGVDWTIEKRGCYLYVLFQGSTTKEDWLHNFDFLPIPVKPYRNMKRIWFCHRGFIRMYKAVRDDINDALELLFSDGGCHYIVVAGHSQGGALAQLCAEDLAYRGYYVSMRTFGSPHVFYGLGAMFHLDDALFTGVNYENGSDIVPLLPPFAFSINSIHIGEPFRMRNVFRCAEYHQGYGDKTLYIK